MVYVGQNTVKNNESTKNLKSTQYFFSPLFSWNNTSVVCFRSAPAAGGAPTEGGAPQQPPNLTSNRRLQQTQAQVDEVSAHNMQTVHKTPLLFWAFKSITVCLTLFCISFPQVVDIMRVNVDKVLERDQKLSELDDRADALQAGASQFETSAAKLKNKYWWKNAKVREPDV